MNAKQMKVREMCESFLKEMRALPHDGTPVPVAIVFGIMQPNSDGTRFNLVDTFAQGTATDELGAEIIKLDARKIAQWEERMKETAQWEERMKSMRESPFFGIDRSFGAVDFAVGSGGSTGNYTPPPASPTVPKKPRKKSKRSKK